MVFFGIGSMWYNYSDKDYIAIPDVNHYLTVIVIILLNYRRMIQVNHYMNHVLILIFPLRY